ncbi:MerR family transcriptional regulator [Ekhidna sp. To15]|uniref:MerR family transcriptional regulator n=1 Tax=Ekhidna sp. To15 TaxID=3395267 RepID=UPI003F51C9E0
MSVYSIKDLEHLSGIKAHTIRIWEQRYDLFSPQRTATNIRFYNNDDLKLILNIATLKDHGYKISKIVAMPKDLISEEVQKISFEDRSHQDQISALTLAMIDLDENAFTIILDECASLLGFEKAMMDIVYPFMRKIGILWMTNSINPAQEHFISHLVRQKMIVATDQAGSNESGPLFLLFLPEGELHELGLLFANYLLRSKGAKTIFFGQTVPLDALEEVYHKLNPQYMLTALTTAPEAKEVQKFIKRLGSKFKSCQVYVTGSRVVGQDLEFPANVGLLNQFEDLIHLTQKISSKVS